MTTLPDAARPATLIQCDAHDCCLPLHVVGRGTARPCPGAGALRPADPAGITACGRCGHPVLAAEGSDDGGITWYVLIPPHYAVLR